MNLKRASAESTAPQLTRQNLGFLLAKASQRWNEPLAERFAAAGLPEVRPSCGSILVPLYEEDGLRIREIARPARLSKQTMTTMVRLLERDGLVRRRSDPEDGRAPLVLLTPRAHAFRRLAESTLHDLGRAEPIALRGSADSARRAFPARARRSLETCGAADVASAARALGPADRWTISRSRRRRKMGYHGWSTTTNRRSAGS